MWVRNRLALSLSVLPRYRPLRFPRSLRRNITTQSTQSTQSTPTSFFPSAEMNNMAPRFGMDGSDIQVIYTPSDFYTTLKAKILGAQHRVFLATLYIGKSEHDLIATLRQALTKTPELKVSVLCDALRGTRETPKFSSATLLAELVEEFGADRVEIRMYHTPNLHGTKKRTIPPRFNEGWGLQHMKLYGFDDEIILSGANLSTDYFTNRQDRYYLFQSKRLTAYFYNIFNTVAKLSYQVFYDSDSQKGFHRLEWPRSNQVPEPVKDPKGFIQVASQRLTPIIQPNKNKNNQGDDGDKEYNTTIYPISQFSPLLRPDTSTEYPTISKLLSHFTQAQGPGSSKLQYSWVFTAGYFNMHPHYADLLLNGQNKPLGAKVITASPESNGFYGSRGISGYLPDAYSHLAVKFMRRVMRSGNAGLIQMMEWNRGGVHNQDGGWSYHAKGIWISDKHDNPSITVVGSSNYTRRAYALDLESDVVIHTTDSGLQGRMKQELEELEERCRVMEMKDYKRKKRRVSLWVKCVTWWIGPKL